MFQLGGSSNGTGHGPDRGAEAARSFLVRGLAQHVAYGGSDGLCPRLSIQRDSRAELLKSRREKWLIGHRVGQPDDWHAVLQTGSYRAVPAVRHHQGGGRQHPLVGAELLGRGVGRQGTRVWGLPGGEQPRRPPPLGPAQESW